MSIKELNKEEKILCNACYEAGQASVISEMRELEQRLKELEGLIDNEDTLRVHMNRIGYNKLNEVEQKLAIAKEALEFYSKQGKYHGFSRYKDNHETYHSAEICSDNGDTAREALKQLGKE